MNPRCAPVCLVAVGMVTGCSRDTGSPAPTTTPVQVHVATPAAELANAGAPAVPAAGKVVAIGNAPEGIVVATSGIGAVAVRNPDAVERIDAATGPAYNAARRRLCATLTASNLVRLIDMSVTGSDPGGGRSLQIVTPDLLELP
jgi:hypothetical protein